MIAAWARFKLGSSLFYFNWHLWQRIFAALGMRTGEDVLRSPSDELAVYTQPTLSLLVLMVGWIDYKRVPLFADLLIAALRLPPQKPDIVIVLALAAIPLVIMLGSLIAFGVLRLVSPATLSMLQNRITLKADARIRSYHWSSIENLRVTGFGPRGGRMIVFDCAPPGTTVNLGGYWDASSDDIVGTMSRARDQWLATHPKHASGDGLSR